MWSVLIYIYIAYIYRWYIYLMQTVRLTKTHDILRQSTSLITSLVCSAQLPTQLVLSEIASVSLPFAPLKRPTSHLSKLVCAMPA